MSQGGAVSSWAPTVTDFMKQRVPLCTLLEPATEPPTKGQLTLRCDGLRWDIVVTASSSGKAMLESRGMGNSEDLPNKPGPTKRKGRTFFIDSSDSDDEHDDANAGSRTSSKPPDSDAYITNLDVLISVHEQLMLPVTQEEWAELGDGTSNLQRRIGRAYRRRCQQTHHTGESGSWADGVKRLDYLEGRTHLVGIEARASERDPISGSHRAIQGVSGTLIFGEDLS